MEYQTLTHTLSTGFHAFLEAGAVEAYLKDFRTRRCKCNTSSVVILRHAWYMQEKKVNQAWELRYETWLLSAAGSVAHPWALLAVLNGEGFINMTPAPCGDRTSLVRAQSLSPPKTKMKLLSKLRVLNAHGGRPEPLLAEPRYFGGAAPYHSPALNVIHLGSCQ